MSQLLALASAVFFGFGDFLGGSATRRMPVWSVLAWSQTFGAPLLAVGVVIVGWDHIRLADVGFGALAGLLGIIGLGILYTALSQGTMSVVAPVAGAIAAVVPVVADVVTGASLEPEEWIGIIAAVAAVLLIGLENLRRRMELRTTAMAFVAGLAFGFFFIAFAETAEEAGLWPLVAARSVTIPTAALIAIVGVGIVRPKRSLVPMVVGVGAFDVSATIALALALQRGSLAVNAVLSSLFPAFTALAAIVLLRERPSRRQQFGIVLALGAAAVLAV